MKKILLTAGFTLFAWGSTCLAQSTYFSDSKEWLRKAEACKPELSYQTISPVKVVRSVQDTKAFQGWRMEDAGQPDILFNEPFKKHLIHFSKQPVNLGFTLFRLFQLRSLLFLRRVSFSVAGIEQPFQQLVLVFLCQHRPVLQSCKHIGIQYIITDIVHGTLA